MARPDWFRLHSRLPRSKETACVADALGIDTVRAVGHLTLFWCWATERRLEGGLLPGASAQVVASASGWQGSAVQFLDALVRAGVVRVSEHGIMVHVEPRAAVQP